MLIFVFSGLAVFLDQFIKHWVMLTMKVGEEIVLIPGVLSLYRLHNPGAAFGFLSGQPWWLIASVQLFAAILLIMIILRYTEGFWGSLGLAAVLGGTIGNLVDRIYPFDPDFPHHVVDMFRFLFIDFAVFNVADIFITMGFITFLIHFTVITFKPDKDKSVLSDGTEPEGLDEDSFAPVDDAELDKESVSGEVALETFSINKAPVGSGDTDTDDDAADGTSEPAGTSELSSSVEAAAPVAVTPVSDVIAQINLPEMPPMEEIPQIIERPDEDLPSHVEPMNIFGEGIQAESEPLVDFTAKDSEPTIEDLISHTGPLPVTEIAPLLDQIYGGKKSAKKDSAASQKIKVQQVASAAVHNIADVKPQAPVAPVINQDLPTVELPALASLSIDGFATPVAAPVPVSKAVSNAGTMLDALSALESELLGEGSGDSYDVDKLLGEYGFESDISTDDK